MANMDQVGKTATNIFQQLWNSFQSESGSGDNTMVGALLKYASAISLAVIAIFLAIVIGMVSYAIYKRSETSMSDMLAEKGASLLNVFESALRTSMAGNSGLQLQRLLLEIAKGSDIEFVSVTMPDGTVIAHSDPKRIGDNLYLADEYLNEDSIKELDPADKEKWFLTDRDGQRVFLIYRSFTLGNKDWDPDVPKPVIFLGMDGSPYEITSMQNRSFVLILSLVTMLVVLCGLLALSFAQRASESRKRQQAAEGKVHKLEEEVRRNEKLAAVGTLAAGVAHEIRNPLSSIKGYATYFRQRSPEGGDDYKAATVMINEVDRLNRVITDLLGLSKQDSIKLRPVRVEVVVAHVMRLIRQNALQKHVEIESRLAPKINPVMGDMERLSQALLNICLNAMEAMPDGGKLEVAIAGGKKRVCINIKDTGEGISKEIIGRIFDPYFTTKGSGTGLGLPMVHKIVTAHKGRLEVVSKEAVKNAEGKIVESGWTIFRIYLDAAV